MASKRRWTTTLMISQKNKKAWETMISGTSTTASKDQARTLLKRPQRHRLHKAQVSQLYEQPSYHIYALILMITDTASSPRLRHDQKPLRPLLSSRHAPRSTFPPFQRHHLSTARRTDRQRLRHLPHRPFHLPLVAARRATAAAAAELGQIAYPASVPSFPRRTRRSGRDPTGVEAEETRSSIN